jgi:1-acyl-sn-glycerol-3-phosphate acyltransferase
MGISQSIRDGTLREPSPSSSRTTCLPGYLRRAAFRTTRFVSKKSIFWIPVLGQAMAVAGFIPIDRSDRTRAIRSLGRASARIRAGASVILFPEGTRSRDGKLGRFKRGAFHLAIDAGVPVVPVAISGTGKVVRPRSIVVRPGPVSVTFSPAIETQAYANDPTGCWNGCTRKSPDTCRRRVAVSSRVRRSDGGARALFAVSTMTAPSISRIRTIEEPELLSVLQELPELRDGGHATHANQWSVPLGVTTSVASTGSSIQYEDRRSLQAASSVGAGQPPDHPNGRAPRIEDRAPGHDPTHPSASYPEPPTGATPGAR